MARALLLQLGVLVCALCTGAAIGQETASAPSENATEAVQSSILILDQDRLFSESLWGRRVADEVATASTALQEENRKIESDLTAEEKALTDKRPTMEAAAFRAEADAFDAKVVSIRAAQEAKARDIAGRQDKERQAFLSAVLPVIGQVLQSRGAVVVLDKKSVFVSSTAIDVTEELIAKIDAAVGDGATVPEGGNDTNSNTP